MRGRLAALLLALAACRPSVQVGAADAGPDGAALDDQAEPEPRPNMVWIPPGALIAGTPVDTLPRVADEEMAGEQVMMRGFYIDVFPYPNEAGAIPTTSVDQAEALAMCQAQDKRLCTELELERACKGPANTVYAYGDTYKAAACGTGVNRALAPNGFNTACRSAFGVHDLHGSVWSWTASAWKRDPAKPGLVAQRGGNGLAGDLLGRCANGRGMRPDKRREEVGFRCCAGEPNTFEVVLSVTRGEPLRWQHAEDRIAPELEKLTPQEALSNARAGDRFKVARLWVWHPLGNEELWIGGGCARPGAHERAACGIVIARLRFEAPALLGWVPSEYWQPTLSEAETPRELFLLGGDRNGAFRRRVSYAWGKIAVGDKERKKLRKGQSEPSF